MRTSLVGLVAILLLAAGCADSDDSPTLSDSGNGASVTTAGPTTSTVPPAASTPATTAPVTTAPETTAPPTTQPVAAVAFTVDGVTGGASVPIEFTCDGANETPAVTIEGVPSNVAELVLIVDDPDAPTASPFVHWVVYGIGADTATITDGDPLLTYGVTDVGIEEWFGPCPPTGDGLHTYRWKLFGLSTVLGLEPGLAGPAVEAAIAEAVVSEALLIASYERAE
jgi:Raf kinase inhibitor-like YbhB/YbcL family protein